MDYEPRVLCVIPARGGSKRIPGKNLKVLAGKPLIQWTIDAVWETGYPWVVSSEDLEMGKLAGVHWLFRPHSLAQDDTTTGEVLVHALETYEGHYDLVVCLHPTSPIRETKHIHQAVAMLWQSKAPSLASVSCRKRCYVHNASIYVVRRDFLLKTKQHYSEESIPFLMDKRHSIDIDDQTDWQIAETLLKGGNPSLSMGSPDWTPNKTA